METSVATSVAQYLGALNIGERVFAYLGLDQSNVVKHSGGTVSQFNLASIEEGAHVLDHLEYLEGLLTGDENPVIIENTQYMSERFVDIHLFSDDSVQWVVFIDNTEHGKIHQTQQQQRLNADILEEARKR